MIDDTEDKIRRNLIVFSFVIIISSVLELNLSLFLSDNNLNFNLHPVRYWTILFIVQIYLTGRFWFHAEVDNNEYKGFIRNKTRIYVTRIISKDLVNKFIGNPSTIQNTDINRLVKENLESIKLLDKRIIGVKVEVDLTDLSFDSGRTKFYIRQIDFSCFDNYEYQATPAISTEFNFDPCVIRYAKFRAFLLSLWSKESLEFLLPLILSIPSTIIILSKIYKLITAH